MMNMSTEKFRGKYRIPSTRLKNHDYGSPGAYFVTIVTKNRENFFGEIRNGKMILSEIGKIARDEWFKTPEIRPDMHIILDAFIVMPNHIHGIIFIGQNKFNTLNFNDLNNNITPTDAVETPHMASLRRRQNSSKPYRNQFGPQRNNLSSVIRGYKSAVTKKSRRILPDFGWQSRFYDHIIRNEKSLNKIRRYIQINPRIWLRDRNNREWEK